MGAHRIIRTGVLLLAATLAPATPGSVDADETRRNFVSCPIVRDTASVPCWLAEYEGELYFLTLQTDVSAPVTPPWLGHRVLVEGTVSAEPRICGGIVLKPVHLSVLPDPAPSCSTMLPAEERYNLSFEPPRPPGPSQGRLAFAPPPNAAPAAAPPVPSAPSTREFVIAYPFDGLVGFSHATPLGEILRFARTVNAREIDVMGYRGAVRLSNGETMIEESGIARKRAEQVAMLLQGANLTGPAYRVRWEDSAAPATGIDDHLTRRVVVTVR